MADAQHPLDEMRDGANDVFLRDDDGFRRLVSEHHALDVQIQQLSTLTYLTEQEQVRESDLKKRKLALKDRIEAMTRGHHGPAIATARQLWA